MRDYVLGRVKGSFYANSEKIILSLLAQLEGSLIKHMFGLKGPVNFFFFFF